jgi:hypothetical protein
MNIPNTYTITKELVLETPHLFLEYFLEDYSKFADSLKKEQCLELKIWPIGNDDCKWWNAYILDENLTRHEYSGYILKLVYSFGGDEGGVTP